MSFGLHIEQRGGRAPSRRSGGSGAPLVVLAVLFAMFCVFDYSPYGGGYVATYLGHFQRWFQGFIAGFRVRL